MYQSVTGEERRSLELATVSVIIKCKLPYYTKDFFFMAGVGCINFDVYFTLERHRANLCRLSGESDTPEVEK